MSPADNAVDPVGTVFRSTISTSMPDSFAASAAHNPAAPAPTMSRGTCVTNFSFAPEEILFMRPTARPSLQGSYLSKQRSWRGSPMSALGQKQTGARGPRADILFALLAKG